MIPKIIHYCWLSGDPVPKKLQTCMNTWKDKLSDYEFILWDTTRFDINSTQWTKQAFDVGVYACAADYIRLYAVYNYGGIYLDMDIEVLKPFDALLESNIFLAHENIVNGSIEAGCFGAKKEHSFIKKCMKYFEDRTLFDPALLPEVLKLKRAQRHEFINPAILPEIMDNAFKDYAQSNELQLLPYTYFTTKNSLTGTIDVKEHTFSIHHYASSYHSKAWWRARELKQKVFLRFGDKRFICKFLIHCITITQLLIDEGFVRTVKNYVGLIKIRINKIKGERK